MGWFWADSTDLPMPTPSQRLQPPPSHGRFSATGDASPPPACPMHKRQRTFDALSSAAPKDAPPRQSSSCPVPHVQRKGSCPQKPVASDESKQSALSKLNPLNYMFRDLSQARAPQQTHALPTSREESSIPRGGGPGDDDAAGGKWEYPSPQQMYNALLRKGYTDTDVTAVESMVAVHNFLNEGAWAEIVEWERRFAKGLARGWRVCSTGKENAPRVLQGIERAERTATAGDGDGDATPSLVRFQGRPTEMTPKAAMVQALGWLYPAKFGTEPPFDRHDWYVSRTANGQTRQIRYVIDYYSGPPEPTGEPVFYLDVRPAFTPTGAAERLLRWAGDVWWRASGGEVRGGKLDGSS